MESGGTATLTYVTKIRRCLPRSSDEKREGRSHGQSKMKLTMGICNTGMEKTYGVAIVPDGDLLCHLSLIQCMTFLLMQ